jgi:broad specificity phosphatase PhoE
LTKLGIEQAKSIESTLQNVLASPIDLVVSSPLRRTIQTTLYGFPSLTKRKVPLEIMCVAASRKLRSI